MAKRSKTLSILCTFFEKDRPCSARKVESEKTTISFRLPRCFMTTELRVFCKEHHHVSTAKDAFKRWKREKFHKDPINVDDSVHNELSVSLNTPVWDENDMHHVPVSQETDL